MGRGTADQRGLFSSCARQRAGVIALLDAALRYGPAVAVVRAPAGFGRTRFLSEVRQQAVCWRSVHLAGEPGSHAPYTALQSMLRDDTFAVHAEADHVGRLLAASHPRPVRIRQAVWELLVKAARHTPTLVTVDDVQFLDAASADALLHGIRTGDTPGRALLATVPSGGTTPLLRAGIPVIDLDRVGTEDAISLLTDELNERVVPAVATRLVDFTGGSIEELLEVASALSPRELRGEVLGPDPLRPTTQMLKLWRPSVESLDEATAWSLLVVALAGHLELAHAAALRDSGLLDWEPLRTQGLVQVRDGRVMVEDGQLRSVVVALARQGDIGRAHDMLARSLRHRQDAEGILLWAHHRVEASERRVEAAVTARVRRAAKRLASVDPQLSAELLSTLARMLAPGSSGNRRLLEAAELLACGGPLQQARELLDDVLRSPTPDVAERAALLRCETLIHSGSPLAAQVLLRCDLDAGDRHSSADRWLIEARAALLVGTVAEARQLGQAALAGASQEVHEVAARATVALCDVLSSPADAARDGLSDALESLQPLATGLGGADLLCTTLVALGLGSTAAPRRELRLLAETYLATGATGLAANALAGLASVEWRSGWWAAAAAHARRAMALAKSLDHQVAEARAAGILALLAAASGDAEACRAYGVQLDGLASEMGSDLLRVPLEHARGLLHLGNGRCARAAEHLGEAWRLADAAGLRNPAVVGLGFDAVDTLVAAGSLREARRALAELGVATDNSSNLWIRAAWAYGSALMVEGPEAVSMARQAAVDFAAVGDPFLRARSDLRCAQLLEQAGQPDVAEQHAYSAFDVFERLQARPWLAMSAALLERVRRQRTEPLTPRLTLRQRDILALVGRGLSNRDIAAALALSEKTVEYHLHRLYQVLGATSRTGLVGIALAVAEPRAFARP